MHYGHGDDSYRYAKKIVANHSTNIWPKGPSNSLITHLQYKLAGIGSYPECYSESLMDKLAVQQGVDVSSVGVFNGIAEAIYLIAQTYRSRKSLIVCPTFSEYEEATLKFDHHISYVHEHEGVEEAIEDNELVWLCNPNNPTGKIYAKEILIDWIQRFPNVLFVIDEAYMELIKNSESLVSEVSNYNNLIVMQSLTKNFAIPGLRLGVVYASPQKLASLHDFRPPWSVNSLAIEAGKYLIDYPPYNHETLKEYLRLSLELQNDLSKLNGVRVYNTHTGFFLLETPIRSGELKDILVEKYGILVRDASNFRGLGEYHIRVASIGFEQNKKLTVALKEIIDYYE
ncbi:aminotransferase class I/II-fold pyridoxal phosphate-dependent enzyme [Halosquirtibacter xylanolyticus]|uniref:aminotransferase class I/II-fold pyridoxal phosphate-dependent enzyme n=1 Tax=Halosquirtibacter xylanolyticus TaxID=3374599 RepID=UPI00374A30A1|nr:aminotransferase class I/II-fold pyridoxal phosphate-dependent enzyme [Prolixibacteraceae bacterium]